jgi:exodeoxyribonuclease VII small subunit
MERNMKYEKAMQELEQIVSQMEDGVLDMDSMLQKLKRAQELVKMCRDKLTKTEAEINAMLSESDKKQE